MDLNYTAEDLAFRDSVRAFLEQNLPADLQQKVRKHLRLEKDDFVRWHRILAKQGWVAPGWPVEFGGTGWTPVQRHLWEEECARAGTPPILPFGVNMVAPVIMAFGSQAQQEHFLPRILSCEDWWCQGYSEPGAGSDLASLKTTAVREGDHYIVNGQKTWTTLAQHADWIFCLCRTDPSAKKQLGISFILIDMKTPGITVRPIQTMDGGREVNEVFFDDVKVPVANLIGQEHRGWDCAKFLLGNERTGIARVGYSKQRVQRIKELAGQVKAGDRPLIEDERFREKVAAVEVELKALEMTQMRVLSEDRARKDRLPNPKSSILKIKGSEIQQRTTELLLEVAGPLALPYPSEADDPEFGSNEPPVDLDWAAPAAPAYFNYRKTTIYGGSNEIQRNILAKAVLGF
jgi:pimeloyl-CoA dehydrogenase large subunit